MSKTQIERPENGSVKKMKKRYHTKGPCCGYISCASGESAHEVRRSAK